MNQTDSKIVLAYNLLFSVLLLIIQLMLYTQFDLYASKKISNYLRVQERKLLQIKKDTVDAINIKMHDLKHFIKNNSTNKEAIEIQALIDNYNYFIKTGNDTLDIIIADYNIRLNRLGIAFEFLGNAKCLDFLDDNTIYSLFGNAIDNAVEASLKSDVSNKLITIKIDCKGDFVSISIKNYFNGSINENNGQLVTSKKDFLNHGFGVKSMTSIVSKYSGSLSYNVDGNIFLLSIYMMNPNK